MRTSVILFERDSWEKLAEMGGALGHSLEVCLAAWSPNGEYLASSSKDGEIMVWQTSTRDSLIRFQRPSTERKLVTGLSWHPKSNELAWAGMKNMLGWGGALHASVLTAVTLV